MSTVISESGNESVTEVTEDISTNCLPCNEDFLKEVYIQCNNIYLSFVNFRFQLFATFVSNAALFAFVYEKKQSIKLDLLISTAGILSTCFLYLIDRRNRHIFKRVIQKAKLIEIYFGVPEDMRIHSKTVNDLKNRISHTIIMSLISVFMLLFWIAFFIYCLYIYH